jgi:RNA polymerase sigma factor (sigma-70 family)
LEGLALSLSLNTRPSLLVRLRDAADGEAWREFVALYAPLVFTLAKKRGLQEADAANVAQEVFLKVSMAIKEFEYDPHRGAFRGWFLTLARNGLHDYIARRKQQCRGSGNSATLALLEELPCPEDEKAVWEREYEQRVFAWAVERVRPGFKETTWQAFWQTAVEGKSGEEAARALGMTVGAVYVAKCRVQARLRAEIQDIESV